MAQAFIRIGEERFKEISISSYRYDGQSTSNQKWYITIWFSRREGKFAFDTEIESSNVIRYLDKVLGVKVV